MYRSQRDIDDKLLSQRIEREIAVTCRGIDGGSDETKCIINQRRVRIQFSRREDDIQITAHRKNGTGWKRLSIAANQAATCSQQSRKQRQRVENQLQECA